MKRNWLINIVCLGSIIAAQIEFADPVIRQ